MFKSIKTYTYSNNTTGITITGPGMVTVIHSSNDVTDYYDREGLLTIDGSNNTICPSQGEIYLFNSSLKIHTTANSSSKIIATVGLFN